LEILYVALTPMSYLADVDVGIIHRKL